MGKAAFNYRGQAKLLPENFLTCSFIDKDCDALLEERSNLRAELEDLATAYSSLDDEYKRLKGELDCL